MVSRAVRPDVLVPWRWIYSAEPYAALYVRTGVEGTVLVVNRRTVVTDRQHATVADWAQALHRRGEWCGLLPEVDVPA